MQKINYSQRIKDLCPQNIQCQDEDCNLLHPRIFAGICISYLQQKEDQCNETLLHLKDRELRNKFKEQKINGIFSFNLCTKQNLCKDKSNCRYLHRKWAEDICIEDLVEECKNKEQCQLKHLDWNDVKKKAYQSYNIHDINPEEIENEKQHNVPEEICIDYLCGLCQFQTSCSKNHIDWECLRNTNYRDLKETRRRQCFYDKSTMSLSMSQQITNQESFQQYFKMLETQQIKRNVQKAQAVDVLFIIDCTGSMQRWLKSAKENIYQIINEFQVHLDKKQNIVRTAIVGYRDYDDEDNLLYREFTTDPTIIKNFLEKLQAKGGGDDPENVIGALEKGIKLNISKDKNSVLCTFLICDNPCHGPYHNENMQDKYFDRVKEGDLENVMSRYYNLKSKNFFTCLKITNNTDIMFSKMKNAFPDLIVTITTPEKFHEFVLFSLKTSVEHSQAKTTKQSQIINIMAKYSKTKPLELDNSLINDNRIDYWQNFLEQSKKNKIQGQTLLKINQNQESLSEFEKGSICQIFKLFDVVLNRNLVLKLPNFIVNKFNKQQNLSEQDLIEYDQFIQSRYNSLLIAQQLAEGFRMKTQQIPGAPPIFYVSPIIYELDESFMGVKNIFAETYIDLPNYSEWKKYTNNARYADRDEYYYTAFSHYSYIATDQKLIITDLQGKNNILTDPSIHTVDPNIRLIINDASNFETDGLIYFFNNQHPKCHEICNQLKLKRDPQYTQISQSIQGQEEEQNNKLVWKRDPQDIINVICQICGEFKDLKYEDYFKQNACICENCLEDEVPTQINCACCRKKFKCFYNQLVKIGKPPDICEQCQLKCVKGNLQCCYCKCYCEFRLKLINIQGQNRNICNEGRRFLNAVKCFYCKELYDFQTFISEKDYQNSFYCCPNCKER